MIEKVARQCILARKDYIPGKPIEEVQQDMLGEVPSIQAF